MGRQQMAGTKNPRNGVKSLDMYFLYMMHPLYALILRDDDVPNEARACARISETHCVVVNGIKRF